MFACVLVTIDIGEGLPVITSSDINVISIKKKKKKKTSTPIQKRSVAYSHLLGMPLETNWHLDILKK